MSYGQDKGVATWRGYGLDWLEAANLNGLQPDNAVFIPDFALAILA